MPLLTFTERLLKSAKSSLVCREIVWPHEVEPWFHFWYRDRVETLILR